MNYYLGLYIEHVLKKPI